MSVGTARQNIIILFWKYQFNFWGYINGNQTFILDSHRPFLCNVVLGKLTAEKSGIFFFMFLCLEGFLRMEASICLLISFLLLLLFLFLLLEWGYSLYRPKYSAETSPTYAMLLPDTLTIEWSPSVSNYCTLSAVAGRELIPGPKFIFILWELKPATARG